MDSNAGCGILLLVAIPGTLILFTVWYSKIQTDGRANTLRSLSDQWDGQVSGGGFWSWPTLEIKVDGVAGKVAYRDGRGDSLWTKVGFNWPASHRLRVSPRDFAIWLRSLVRGSNLKVGDPEFESIFWVEAEDVPWAREVLSRRVQAGMLRLREDAPWSASKRVSLDIGPTGIVLKIGRLVVDNPRELEEFISLAILILRSTRNAVDIAGVVLSPVEIQGGSGCPVCGHIVEKGRTCPACRTPHHEDCWKYSGGCAIFACAGRPAQARRAS